ncbi:MAG: OmpH family outer membrane protein [Bacteroidaceae bacterium]|nr:OmpH family outer membrane protein [Bacteroidaceae bacterium]
MKKMLFLTVSLMLALTACQNEKAEKPVNDAKATETEEPAGLRIAYVEVDSLMSQYQFCKDYNLVLTKKAENIQNTLISKQRALQQHAAALQKKYESNGFTTRDELERAQASIQKEQQDYAELEQRLGNELASENAKLNEELRDSIQTFLKTFNKTKKFDYILTKQGDNILMANPKFDITNQVVAGLNKRYKTKPETNKEK